MSRLTLEKAKEILKKHTTEDHLLIHAQSVSAAMGAMADYFHEDRDHWEAIGYLHDVDYEAVSYTHLDVYKRQGKSLICRSKIKGSP